MSKLALPGFRGEHPMAGRPALVHLDLFTGVVSVRATVIGETPKRYRVRFEEDAPGLFGYRAKGTVHLIPKGSVTFLDGQGGEGGGGA